MGHCSCGAHSCAAEKKVDAKVSVFHEYGKVIFSLLLLTSGIIMNALDLAFFREGSVALIWYIVAYLPVGIPVMKEAWESKNSCFLLSLNWKYKMDSITGIHFIF